MKITDISPAMFARASRVEAGLRDRFAEIDAVAQENTLRAILRRCNAGENMV